MTTHPPGVPEDPDRRQDLGAVPWPARTQGMHRESYTRAESLHRSGRWLDGVGYAILAEEWRGRSDLRSFSD